MRYLICLIIILNLVACAPGKVSVEAIYRTQYDAFIAAGKVEGIDLSRNDITIQSGAIKCQAAIGGVAIACCDMPLGVVIMDLTAFNTLSGVYRELIVFHELGHCLLKRQHSNGDSIMFPIVANPTHYNDRRDAYIHELFHP